MKNEHVFIEVFVGLWIAFTIGLFFPKNSPDHSMFLVTGILFIGYSIYVARNKK